MKDKIKKLLAKASDTTIGEIESASFARKAAELMFRYDMQLSDLDDPESEKQLSMGRVINYNSLASRDFEYTICTAIGVYFSTKYVIIRDHHPKTGRRIRAVGFYGQLSDCELSDVLYNQVNHACDLAADHFINDSLPYLELQLSDLKSNIDPKSKATYKKEFKKGYYQRVAEKLIDMQSDKIGYGNEFAVMIVSKKDKLAKYIGEQHFTKSSRFKRVNASKAGRDAGEGFNINRGVGGTRAIG